MAQIHILRVYDIKDDMNWLCLIVWLCEEGLIAGDLHFLKRRASKLLNE